MLLKKPREWEIATHHNASGHYNAIVNGPKTSGEELVHVVEFSAYDSINKTLELAVQALLMIQVNADEGTYQHNQKRISYLCKWALAEIGTGGL